MKVLAVTCGRRASPLALPSAPNLPLICRLWQLFCVMCRLAVPLAERRVPKEASIICGLITCMQAMMTSSAFVMDWSRPVPVEEFFLPVADVTIPAYRACVAHPDLHSRRFRITRQPNATANEQMYSSAKLLTSAVDISAKENVSPFKASR